MTFKEILEQEIKKLEAVSKDMANIIIRQNEVKKEK